MMHFSSRKLQNFGRDEWRVLLMSSQEVATVNDMGIHFEINK